MRDLEEGGGQSRDQVSCRQAVVKAVNTFMSRYKRRGVDEEGKVANYVETEQIILYHTYALSFIQVYALLSLAAHILASFQEN